MRCIYVRVREEKKMVAAVEAGLLKITKAFMLMLIDVYVVSVCDIHM